MGLIYITAIIAILSVVTAILLRKNYEHVILDTTSFMTGFLSIATLTACFIILIGKQSRINNIKTNYNSLVELTQNHRSDSTKDVERAGLIQELYETNKRINLHRTYINCKWSSVFYSQEVANLKLLK